MRRAVKPGGFISRMLLMPVWLLFQTAGMLQAQHAELNTELRFSSADSAFIMNTLRSARLLTDTDPDSALQLFRQGLELSRTGGFHSGIANALIYTSKIYADKGLFRHSLFLLNEAKWYAGLSEEARRDAHFIYNNIGIVYHHTGNYYRAAQYYYRAAQLAEAYDSSQLAMIYSNLSGVLFVMGLEDQSLHYLEKARQMAVAHGNHRILAKVLLNIGTIFSEKKDADRARRYFRHALDTSRRYALQEAEYEAHTALAGLFLRQDMPDSTLHYLGLAGMLEFRPGAFRENAAQLLRGEAYLQLGRFEEGEEILKHAQAEAGKGPFVDQLAESHKALAGIYALRGRYQAAYRHIHAYMDLKDSLQNRENARNINQLEVRYQTVQKDKELAENRLTITRQEKDIARKNMWITGIVSGLLLTAVLLTAVYRSYRSRQRMQEKQIEILRQKQEISDQKQEIRQLKAVMHGEEKERKRIARELHDGIGGMLSAVKMNLSAVRKTLPAAGASQEFESVMRMLQETSSEVRKTAHNLMPDILVRHRLPEALRIYSGQISAGETLTVSLQTHGALDDLDKAADLLIYRTVQELLQNIVKHSGASRAVVQLIRSGDTLDIIVEDDGAGFDVREQHEGYGLQNLRFRIQALRGSVSIESARQVGTTIFIRLDIQELNKTFNA